MLESLNHSSSGGLYWSFRAVKRKVSQTGWLKQQIICFLTIWRLEIKEQGTVIIGFWQILSSWLSDSCSVHAHPWVSLSVSSFKDTNPVGLGPTSMMSFNLSYLFKVSTSKYNHISTSTYRF